MPDILPPTDDSHAYPKCPACGDPIDYCPGHGDLFRNEEDGEETEGWVVRAIADGLLITYRVFGDREHTASAFYASTCDWFRRLDHESEVTVQMVNGDQIEYETTFPRA